MIAVTQEDRRFFIFSKIWCLSTLFHLASFSYWFDSHPVTFIVTLASCLLHLLFSWEHKLYYLGLAGSIILVWLQIPFTPNHIFFEWFLNILFGLVLINGHLFTKKDDSISSYFFGKSITATRWSIVILYFFVVLHKLNYDYYDPISSCGAVLFEQIFERSGIFRIPIFRDSYYSQELNFKLFSIYFTLAAEFMIPVMLMVRKCRNAGLVFGILFHLLLSLHGHNGIFSFSAMLFTVFIFFWNDNTVDYFYDKWIFYQSKIKLFVLLFFALSTAVLIIFPYRYYVIITLLIWYAYAVVYFLLFLKVLKGNYSDTFFTVNTNLRTAWLWVIPVLIFFNGIMPYIGLKTEASFSMFSNLRTEGGITNHQFIPVSWQIFDYQKNLISIHQTNYDRLQNLDLYHGQKDVKMVMFEFVKILNAAPENVYVEYDLNGQKGIFEKSGGKIVRSDIDLYVNPVMEKLFDFRLVHTEKSLCKH